MKPFVKGVSQKLLWKELPLRSWLGLEPGRDIWGLLAKVPALLRSKVPLLVILASLCQVSTPRGPRRLGEARAAHPDDSTAVGG